MTTKKKLEATKKTEKNILQIKQEKDKTQDRQFAEISLSAITLNTLTTVNYSIGSMGEISITDAVAVMKDKVNRVNTGDLSQLESALTAQAVSLNAIYNEMARRAIGSELMSQLEVYLRLGLKAQAQCARTIETLAAIKNPPVVFAKQMNVANGNQQVNNGSVSNGQAPSHTGEIKNQSNELLEAQHHGEWLDRGKTAKTSRADKALETVGAVNRGAND